MIKKIGRKIRKWFRKGTWEFPPEEIWDLSYYSTKFLYPRIRKLAMHHVGYPSGLTDEQWTTILNVMALGFLSYYVLSDGVHALSREDKKWIKKTFPESVQRDFRLIEDSEKPPYMTESLFEKWDERERQCTDYTKDGLKLFHQYFFDLWD